MMLLSNIFNGIFSYTYKSIGLEEKISDRTLAWAGSVSALIGGVTRVLIGSMYDNFGFRTLFIVLMVINAFICFTCYASRHNTTLYFIAI